MEMVHTQRWRCFGTNSRHTARWPPAFHTLDPGSGRDESAFAVSFSGKDPKGKCETKHCSLWGLSTMSRVIPNWCTSSGCTKHYNLPSKCWSRTFILSRKAFSACIINTGMLLWVTSSFIASLVGFSLMSENMRLANGGPGPLLLHLISHGACKL